MRIIYGLILALWSVAVTAQNPLYPTDLKKRDVDSLTLFLNKTVNDTVRMSLCRDLSFYYQEIDRDSSLRYAERLLTLAKKNKQRLWEATAYWYEGYVLNMMDNYPKSFQAFDESLKIAEDESSEQNIWHISSFILDQNPKRARLNVLSNIIADLANLHGATNDKVKMMRSFDRAIYLANSNRDSVTLSFAYMNLGSKFMIAENFDSALYFSVKALQCIKSSGYRKYESEVLRTIGAIFSARKNPDSALFYFKKALQVSISQKVLASLALYHLSTFFLQNNQPDSAVYYAHQAVNYFSVINSKRGVMHTYKHLANIYSRQKKTDSAWHYMSLAVPLNDSLVEARISNLTKYQTLSYDREIKLQQLENEKAENISKIKTYGMLAVASVFLLITFILYRNNKQKQKANKILEQTLTNLKSTQSQLIQSEKMASLGELTAGIAHEIQNPLNFVNNFSEVNKELADELAQEIEKGNYLVAKTLAKDIKENEGKINHHGKRADSIVKGMLQHSRKSNDQKELTDLNVLCDEYLRLAYHGLRAKDKSFNAKFETDFDTTLPKINVVPQDIGRVILNLITNAFYAVNENKKLHPSGYESLVKISTKSLGDKIQIVVTDNGPGIPEKIKDKIFHPFFTTKPTGQGTGLGLSLSYDIVKAHAGEIKMETKEGEGSTFIMKLPLTN
jgi:two-component system NtrC family sensor kinase